MITSLLAKIFGTKNQRELKRLRRTVEIINNLEPRVAALSNDELKNQTALFRERYRAGESLKALLPEAFATAREASKRALNMRHFDVQLIGGMVLHEGKISEMKTGEGKTLVATLALYLNSLSGKGAHLVTVNDYLARRDAEWMMPLYHALGVSVGIMQHDQSEEERKAAYNSDITYGTNNEFGFDYLRDNMKFSLDNYVQRELAFAIVDEVDSILIDEARTPLIISGPSEKSSNLYQLVNQLVVRLKKESHYEVDEKSRSVHLLDDGVDQIEKMLSIENLYAPEHTLLLHHLTQALKAHAIFKRDVDYVVRDNQVLIIDEFTGRILSGRRYSDGLHQALEAKENVKIERENQTLASITLQNYFRLYGKLAGMTGTAATESEEFYRIYKLEVVSIPTNKPLARVDEPDAIFLSRDDKFEAIIEDMIASHKRGQPVLVGTISVETSEYLGSLLTKRNIPHNILNAKQHAREAEIVAEAGLQGKITIATNMAGRGTDIKLGEGVLALGGLRIIGTERHESRRIDNQLRGRSGRQGDPGSSKFYLSLDDDLIRIFGGDRLKNIMTRVGMQPGERIEHPMISRSIERAQERVEKQHFESRKHLIEYDDVLNQQRKVVYAYRRELLDEAANLPQIVAQLFTEVIDDLQRAYPPQKHLVVSDAHKNLSPHLQTFVAKHADFLEQIASLSALTSEQVLELLHQKGSLESSPELITDALITRYRELEKTVDAVTLRQAEKWTLLEIIDHYWKMHLQVIDSLKEGIGLRGYGQKNPLIEYKKESFDAFVRMMQGVKWDSVHRLLQIRPESFSQSQIQEIEDARREEMAEMREAGPTEEVETAPVRRDETKVGRNDNCVCGSQKKFKHCCGRRVPQSTSGLNDGQNLQK